jgi:hypothetical protein
MVLRLVVLEVARMVSGALPSTEGAKAKEVDPEVEKRSSAKFSLPEPTGGAHQLAVVGRDKGATPESTCVVGKPS